MWLYHIVVSPKDADGMANSVDPDQTALLDPDQTALLFSSVWKLRIITVNMYTVNLLIVQTLIIQIPKIIWATSSKFGTYRLCEQQRFRRACASAQSCQNLCCLLIQAVSQEEPSDRKSDPWPLWMAGHAQSLSHVTECSKTQIRLTGLILGSRQQILSVNSNSQYFYNIVWKGLL